MDVGGVPLVLWACLAAWLVADVVVSTDEPLIARATFAACAGIVKRPQDVVRDISSSEDALRRSLDTYGKEHQVTVDVLLLVQCTTPYLTASDVERATAAVVTGGADTAHTVAAFHGFVWREDSGRAYGIHHGSAFRPRCQDRPENFLETGAAYAVRADGFRAAHHRFFGRTALVCTDPDRALEIDEPGSRRCASKSSQRTRRPPLR